MTSRGPVEAPQCLVYYYSFYFYFPFYFFYVNNNNNNNDIINVIIDCWTTKSKYFTTRNTFLFYFN